MSNPAASPRETAIDTWNQALETYRMSVDLYARVVKLRRRRESRLLPTVMAVAARGELSPPPPSVLDELTPREREVALLIARGLSNRQIAHNLVITQGTAANHVAHIIGKLGISNRIGIAAAVLTHSNGHTPVPEVELMPSVRPLRATPKARPGANFVPPSNLRAVDTGRRASAG